MREGATMILILDTTQLCIGKKILENAESKKIGDYELIDTTNLKISHCIGCNHCWLKTPGICSIKDDYEEILKKIIRADRLWLVTDTKFGFVSYRGKNIIDRILPIATMNLHIKNGEMRHVSRYDRIPDFGVVYCGDGDKAYLEQWAKRVAINFESNSLGAYSENEMQGVAL